MPKKKKTGKIIALCLAFAAVMGLSYAVSVKMTRENTIADNTTTLPPVTDEITSAGTDSDFTIETETLPDIFANAKKLELTEETDLKTVCINRFTLIDREYEAMLKELSAGDGIFLWEEAADAFEQMYSDALDAGMHLTPFDGYCGFDRQDRRYESKVTDFVKEGQSRYEAQLSASYFVLPSGHSEQYLGLCVAVGEETLSFDETEEYQWLRENAADYGFVERYPSGKESVTYINYEPWLWRYVGVDNAKEMISSGCCLEEFVR